MTAGLIKFLSKYAFVEDEKKLFSEISDYLKACHGLEHAIVYSSPAEELKITNSQSRIVLSVNCNLEKSQFELYSKNIKTLKNTYFSIVDENTFYLNLGSKNSQKFSMFFKGIKEIDEEILEALSVFSQEQLRTIDHVQKLYKSQELIHIDDVTGLYNQRKLYKDLNYFVDKFNIDKEPFCVLFVDIDHFKKVNDGHGHLVGTRLLESVALDIKHLLRDSDLCYRYGGDEFVIILSNADADTGKIVGERILSKVKNKEYQVDLKTQQTNHFLSVSIGVAGFPKDAINTQEVLAIADRMMYEAKESGRGKVFNTQDTFKNSLKKVVNDKKL